MSVEQQKLSLIEQIATLDDASLVYQLAAFLEGRRQPTSQTTKRQVGFAKGSFPYVATDFDDSIPPGFDDYMLNRQ